LPTGKVANIKFANFYLLTMYSFFHTAFLEPEVTGHKKTTLLLDRVKEGGTKSN